VLRDRAVARRMTAIISSQQVAWLTVHEFVAPLLAGVGCWPMAGTPEWCLLDDDDPRKWAALFDAAQHWSLRVDTCQEQQRAASRDISAAVDWSSIARELVQLNAFYTQRPRLKRVTT
jgi:Protein of unknown function (DUF2742)